MKKPSDAIVAHGNEKVHMDRKIFPEGSLRRLRPDKSGAAGENASAAPPAV
jgi:hypothetical protein